MPASTPSQKYAMRAQNQAIIMDENTISYYLNRGYIVSEVAPSLSQGIWWEVVDFIQRIR